VNVPKSMLYAFYQVNGPLIHPFISLQLEECTEMITTLENIESTSG